MSTYKTISQQIKEIDNWLRLATLLHGPLKQTLLCVLHNRNKLAYQGLPEDPSELYKELSTTHQKTIKDLVKRKILKKDQLEILLPSNGENKTYSDTFDVTLIVVLIINCTTLPQPVGGWNQKSPLESDPSVAANALRGREWRNYMNHADAKTVDKTIFNQKWTEGMAIIKGLGGSVKDAAILKTASLDRKSEVLIQSLMEFNQRKISHLQSEVNNLKVEVASATNRLDSAANKLDEQGEEIKLLENRRDEQNDAIQDQLANHSQALNQLQNISEEVNQLNSLNKECSPTHAGKFKNMIIHVIN